MAAAAEEVNKPPALPAYPKMIVEAISALDDKNGSNKSSISKYIESQYPDLPAGHTTLLSHHLMKMKATGELLFVKNNYMRPDPDSPARRGRGRPPKPKEPLPPGTVLSSPRPRGRPPKPKDPQDLAATKASTGMLKPRGRPPKIPKSDGENPTSSSLGPKRGRGRPPKVKPTQFEAVGFV